MYDNRSDSDMLRDIVELLREILEELQSRREPPPSGLTWTDEAWQKVRDEKARLREESERGS